MAAKPASRPAARIQDWLAWGLARLGWPGWAGAGLLLAAGFMLISGVVPMEQEAARLSQRADRLALRPPVAPKAERVRDWREDLPSDQEGYARLARLFGAASRAGLNLAEGSYREVRDAKLGLTRLSITLPVAGSYGAIRGFMAQALNQEPALALESLRISRDAIANTELNADLRFTLYLTTARPLPASLEKPELRP